MNKIILYFSLTLFLCISIQGYANHNDDIDFNKSNESKPYLNNSIEQIEGDNATKINVLMITASGEAYYNVTMYLRFDGENYILTDTSYDWYTGWYVQKNDQKTYNGIDVRNYSHWVYAAGNMIGYFFNLR